MFKSMRVNNKVNILVVLKSIVKKPLINLAGTFGNGMGLGSIIVNQ